MEQRKWEDLDKDCLVKVFEKVDMESLLLDVPFVCKSWHKETLNPSCWKSLIFPEFEPDEFDETECDYPIYQRFVSEFRLNEDRFSVKSFIKFVVNRSQGNAISLKLPSCCSSLEAFEYVANGCPQVMFFGLPRFLLYDVNIDLELIGKFKYLFMLSLGCCESLDKVLSVVSKHCKFFSHLILSNSPRIGKEECESIANLVPHIKSLIINGADIDRDSLVILLKRCKELVNLEANNCVGFKENDDEIAMLASHIEKFHCEGSRDREEFAAFSLKLSECISEFLADTSFDFSIFQEVEGPSDEDGGVESIDEEDRRD